MAFPSQPLVDLRDEADQVYPDRDRRTDGWIGDKAHAERGYPKTKHMPNKRGCVHGRDFDADGLDPGRLIAVFQSRPEAYLWIYNGQIALAREGWRRRTYTGPNKHRKHLHKETRDEPATERVHVKWGLAATLPTMVKVSAPSGTPTAGGGMVRLPTLRRDPRRVLAAVRQLERVLRRLGYDIGRTGPGRDGVDGQFGDRVRVAVVAFQRKHGLTADGVVGPVTWTALAQALLNRFGHGLAVDGRFGPRTRAATAGLQRMFGLSVDGWFGPKSWAVALR